MVRYKIQPRTGRVGNCFGLRATPRPEKLAEGRTF